MDKKKNLEGLNGWLILVAIGMVLAPIRIVITLLTTYPQIFSSGTWEALTTKGNEGYNPLWGPIIIGELSINFILLMLLLYLAYLFFSKSRHFPKWFIGIAIFSIVFIVADAFAVKMVAPNEPVFDPDTIREFMHSVMVAVIWVPYMLVSKRVKATFIK
ncbi:DUF2569 domain-containing protein [Legionella quinlivanii]|uniref:DUF2569 domain-containing protein n=1 Tax=Legionella quinlivanii TaxID=45073 RepID=UPI00224474D3|nr:DUF2569 domain-containing protein [Legionella quinlivanii]MCW8451823.1 DUF2569 domain-containing protein [Legionella quinlivanii]